MRRRLLVYWERYCSSSLRTIPSSCHIYSKSAKQVQFTVPRALRYRPARRCPPPPFSFLLPLSESNRRKVFLGKSLTGPPGVARIFCGRKSLRRERDSRERESTIVKESLMAYVWKNNARCVCGEPNGHRETVHGTAPRGVHGRTGAFRRGSAVLSLSASGPMVVGCGISDAGRETNWAWAWTWTGTGTGMGIDSGGTESA